jgi:geranylgeranyl diphosphate synthase type II
LLTAAFSYVAKAPFSAETRIRAVEVLSECAGELGMVGGQVLDISSEQRECTEQEVLDIHSRKTGALIRAACILGVLAGGGCQKDIQAAAEYASHFGLAFQIRDDVLDRVGDPQEMGKSVFSDDAKNTFVRLYGIDECYRMICSHTDEAVEALSSFSDNWFMIALTDFLSGRRK